MRVWEDDPFHEADELDVKRWESILARSRYVQARLLALSLLSRTEHSRFLLRRKLLLKDVEPDVADSVVRELADSGALSDERYAASWIRSRMRSHPEGRAHLVAGLRNRGVDADTAERAVDRVLDDDALSLLDGARLYVERLSRRSATPERMAERLYRRGFSPRIVRRVIAEVAGADIPDVD